MWGIIKGMKADVVIVGGGPAGLSAGIFACRAGLNVVLFEGLAIGGQAAISYKVANYPGFEDISGAELTQRMHNQATSFGLKTVFAEVLAITKTKTGFSVKTKQGSCSAKKVVLACGCKARRLELANEKELIGRGVSYCASCDGNFFKNMPVAVVGGGNTAIEDVDYLTKIASKVYLINRSDIFRAGQHELARVKKFKNVQVLTNAVVTKLVGQGKLTQIEVKQNGKKIALDVEGLFLAIGSVPQLDFLKFDVDVDKRGYIVVDANMQTSVKNLFACGDVISKNFRQIVAACADGAIAGNACIAK